jgi:hypothetical protein
VVSIKVVYKRERGGAARLRPTIHQTRQVIVQAGLDQSVHTTKSKNLRRGSIQSRKRVAKKQPSPAAMPSFYQHQAGGNHQPPDRQQSMDNCKCTIC